MVDGAKSQHITTAWIYRSMYPCSKSIVFVWFNLTKHMTGPVNTTFDCATSPTRVIARESS